jgi:two-component sensor histidine kinase
MAELTMDLDARRTTSVSPKLLAMSEDAFLLLEANHRVSNELAAAIAALRLVKAARGSRSRWKLLGEALERLEAFAITHRHFTAVPACGESVDVGMGIETICTALATARRSASGSTMKLDLPATFVEAVMARNLTLIADELVTNAIKYGLEDRGGIVIVTLRDTGGHLHLVVSDDGPGASSAAGRNGSGLGSGIVAEIVRRAGGEMSFATGSCGTTVQVSLPRGTPCDA